MKEKKQMSIEQDNKIESSTSYLRLLKNKAQKIKKIIILSLGLLVMNSGMNSIGLAETAESKMIMYMQENYLESVRSKLQEDLIIEVDNYINTSAPGAELDSRTLVALCLQYNMDIPFVLAQGVLESHLGTKGKAVQTNSVWNVGAYDDGTIKHRYENVNESIEPYLLLIQEKYLGGKKELKDLVRDGGFKTLKGHRYASSTVYESRMRTYITYINLNTSISMYQDVLSLSDEKILGYFSPREDLLIIPKDTTKIALNLNKNDSPKRKF